MKIYLLYTVYIEYILIFEGKNMSVISVKSKKRKIIDLPEETFRALSILASANGTNLKSFIETLLDNEAKILKEEQIYKVFLTDPDAQEIVSTEEKLSFENWLGV